LFSDVAEQSHVSPGSFSRRSDRHRRCDSSSYYHNGTTLSDRHVGAEWYIFVEETRIDIDLVLKCLADIIWSVLHRVDDLTHHGWREFV